ncbi:MAG: macro domain-containing protein [Candidatus Omnitrophica bacterium]|nr:macro domain-containing protein [Candidatus Omnitrophota bacterium]
MIIRGAEIKVVKADITELVVEALVNAANNKLVMGGGVAGAIRKKGGAGIEEEAVRQGPIRIGEAVHTSAGTLKARYIIHAATMGMDFKTDEAKVRAAARSSLDLAQELKISSIAFPALGCGTGGFPLLASAKIMAQEVLKYLRNEEHTLKEIVFCVFDDEAYAAFNKGVLAYLDYVTQKLQAGPFVTVDAIIEMPLAGADGTGVVLVERSNPPFGWALPGGFVDYGESLEEAVAREVKEETNLELEGARQFHTYSMFGRDPRFHTVGTVFYAKGKGELKAGDDAQSAQVVPFGRIEKINFAFDHKDIILHYLSFKEGKDPF